MHRFKVSLLLACIPVFAFAQSGEWGSRGNTQRFAVRGNLVFAADGRGVAVYDATQPATIHRVAVAETASESTDLAFIDDNDLAVATRTGVERFNVAADGTLARTNVSSDEVASRIASSAGLLAGITPDGIMVWDTATGMVSARFFPSPPPAAIAFHGQTLLAAVPQTGVILYDLSGAQNLITIPEDARDIAVSGDVVSIAAGAHGLVRYDLSGPAPAPLDRSGAGAVDFATVAVSGQRAFVTEQPNHIHVFDLTSGTPVLASSFDEPAQAISASGTELFASGFAYDQFGVAGFSGAPLRVFDTSNASSPRFAGQFSELAGPISGVVTDGTLAYVVDLPFFRVIDVSTSNAPREIANLRLDGFGDRLRVSGKQAIVYGRGDVQLIDISNPYAPSVIKVFHSSGGPPSGAGFARSTIIEANAYSGFHVVDFENFPQPVQIGGLKGHYSEVAADGDTAWAMYFATNLTPVDLSDPHNPRLGKITIIGGTRLEFAAATANHPELLMLLAPDGVHLFSVANPLAPVETSFTPMASATALAADGDRALVAAPGIVQSLDLLNPSLQATGMHPVSPMGIAGSGGKVVIADRYSLRVFGPNTAPPPPTPAPRRRPSGR